MCCHRDQSQLNVVIWVDEFGTAEEEEAMVKENKGSQILEADDG